MGQSASTTDVCSGKSFRLQQLVRCDHPVAGTLRLRNEDGQDRVLQEMVVKRQLRYSDVDTEQEPAPKRQRVAHVLHQGVDGCSILFDLGLEEGGLWYYHAEDPPPDTVVPSECTLRTMEVLLSALPYMRHVGPTGIEETHAQRLLGIEDRRAARERSRHPGGLTGPVGSARHAVKHTRRSEGTRDETECATVESRLAGAREKLMRLQHEQERRTEQHRSEQETLNTKIEDAEQQETNLALRADSIANEVANVERQKQLLVAREAELAEEREQVRIARVQLVSELQRVDQKNDELDIEQETRDRQTGLLSELRSLEREHDACKNDTTVAEQAVLG